MKYYCISDLHIGDKSKKDDFYKNEQKLIDFLLIIPDKSLILVGDILELWQCKSENIWQAYPDLLFLLFTKTKYYVVGNHDLEILETGLPYFITDVITTEKLIVGNILFMHGHQFDLVNAKNKGLGFWVTKIAGWLEKHIDKDIDVKFEHFVMWLKKQGRFGTPAVYKRDAVNFVKNMETNKQPIKQIVIGHTHVEDYAKINDIEYYNCGTWTNGKSHIVEIET